MEGVTQSVPGLAVDTAQLREYHQAFLAEQRGQDPSVQYLGEPGLPLPRENAGALAGSEYEGLDPAGHGVVRHPGLGAPSMGGHHPTPSPEAEDTADVISLDDLFGVLLYSIKYSINFLIHLRQTL